MHIYSKCNAYNTNTHTHTHAPPQRTHTHTHTHAPQHTHTHTHTLTPPTHTHTHTHTYLSFVPGTESVINFMVLLFLHTSPMLSPQCLRTEQLARMVLTRCLWHYVLSKAKSPWTLSAWSSQSCGGQWSTLAASWPVQSD